jgi:hypothetical protein
MRTLITILSLAACSSSRVIVSIENGGLHIPEDIDEVHLLVEEILPDTMKRVTRYDSPRLPLCYGGATNCRTLPITAALVPGDQHPDDTVAVRVEARHLGDTVISDSATFTFVKDHEEHLRFVLRPICVGSDCARFEQACNDEGQCVPFGLAPSMPDLATTSDAGGLPLGSVCSQHGDCSSGHCIDSVCCDNACSGQCQACNLAVPGTCALVESGQPRLGRQACAGSGTLCAGSCDGTSPTECGYPAKGTTCGASCDGTCDGLGHCSATATGTCPGGFACGASACLTSCSSPSDCQSHFDCVMGSCVRQPEVDCLDGADDNGDNLADCQDPTCLDRVGCVGAPAGDEVGLLTDQPCPSPYALGASYYQNLVVPKTCSGCTCKAWVTCQIDFQFSAATNCGADVAGPSVTETNLASDNTQLVTPICAKVSPPPDPVSIHMTPTYRGTSCTNDGSAAKPDATSWGTQKSFCRLTRSSQTCDTGQRCVAKSGASAQQCVRVPSPDASCPAGYANGVNWYDATQFTDSRSCSCGCNYQGGDCTGRLFVAISTVGCPVADTSQGDFFNETNNCTNNSLPSVSFDWWTQIGGMQIEFGMGRNATCTSAGSTMGSAQAVNGSTICCQ